MKKFQKYRYLLKIIFSLFLVSMIQISCSKKEQRSVITQRNKPLKNKSLSPLPVKLDKGNYVRHIKKYLELFDDNLFDKDVKYEDKLMRLPSNFAITKLSKK